MAGCVAQQPYNDVDISSSTEDDDSICEEEEEELENPEPGKVFKRADTLFYDAGHTQPLHSPEDISKSASQCVCKLSQANTHSIKQH